MKAAVEITWKDGLGAKKSLEEAAKEAAVGAWFCWGFRGW
jgi:hypothetical protein